jgi:hypothetical protein
MAPPSDQSKSVIYLMLNKAVAMELYQKVQSGSVN